MNRSTPEARALRTGFWIGLIGSLLLPLTVEAQVVPDGRLEAFTNGLRGRQVFDEARLSAFLEAHRLAVDLPPGAPLVALHRFEGDTPRFVLSLSNADAARDVSAAAVHPGGGEGFALTGAGQFLGVWDAGAVRASHREFDGAGASRVVRRDTFGLFNNHATAIAGSMIGAGVDPEARGMSYEASAWTYEWAKDLVEMATASGDGLRVSNHSYGDANGWGPRLTVGGVRLPAWYGDPAVDDSEDFHFGFYGDSARDWDQLAYLAPHYLIVKAAGNDRGRTYPAGTMHWVYNSKKARWDSTDAVREPDGGTTGYDTIIGDGSSAKNVLTVGAAQLDAPFYQRPSDVGSFLQSSWGPTDDGRIKPDLVAPGNNGYSAGSAGDAAYTGINATSMASAVLSGTMGLLMEERDRQGLPPLQAAGMRALLIHTAREAGPGDGPDYAFGWGLADTFGAARLIAEDGLAGGGTHILEVTLSDRGVLTVPVESQGAAPLKVTLAWTDPPSTPPRPSLDPPARMLVNDLDLRVVGPDGTALPWVLDPSRPASAATTGDNHRDNVEQVVVAAPAPGVHEIRVTHKGRLAGGLQDLALIVSGNRNPALYRDQDGDGIYSVYEDVDADGSIFNDDTDGNGVPNYLDDDDDGDEVPTRAEVGVIVEGRPVDPPDRDGDGEPDYLDVVLLDVELTAFYATPVGEDRVALVWSTATETHNAGFAVEHAAGDAPFVEIAFVPGSGPTLESRSYRYEVGRLAPGRHAFRLRQVDLDGSAAYSPTVEVALDLPDRSYFVGSVYPNPVRDEAAVQVVVKQPQRVTARVYDALGRAVGPLSIAVALPADQARVLRVPVRGLPGGAYVLLVRGASFSEARPLVVLE